MPFVEPLPQQSVASHSLSNSFAGQHTLCTKVLLPQCLQGIICFEGIMQLAEQKGISKKGAPVVCKPHAKVSTASHCHLWYERAAMALHA